VLTYLFKRIIAMIPTLLGITFITFLIINLAPGDPVATQFGQGGSERGAGAGEGGGGGDRERQADAIKAKKKLLGMVREDHTVSTWGLGEAVQEEIQSWPRLARLGELPGWPQALLVLESGALVVGTHEGSVLRLDAGGVPVWTARPAEGGTSGITTMVRDGERVLVGDGEGRLTAFSLEDGAMSAQSTALGRGLRDLQLLPDGTVASAGEDGLVRLHDASSLNSRQGLEGHVSGVYALALLPDGTLLSAGYDRKLRAWDTGSGALRYETEPLPQAVNEIALSPDGSQLALAGDDRAVHLVEVAPLPELRSRSLEGHFKAVSTVAWSADSSRLVSGSRDETARLWEVASGKELARTPDVAGAVRQVLVVGETVYTGARSWAEVPVWKRYLSWLWRTITLDFDRSFVDDRPVMEKITAALPITIFLNVIALAIIYLISIPLGVLAAVRRGGVFDQVSSVILFLLYSIPNFWLATLLIMGLSSERTFDLLPSVGLYSRGHQDLSYLSWLWDRSLHLVLPVTVMVYGGFASLSRYARTTMLETIQEDYVRTARAKGLPEYLVVFKHAFRNSLITIVTLVANLLPAMIGGSVIVEYIFSIEGMGRLGFDAILARDYPVIMAITTFSAVLTLLGILVSDLLYSVVDPRVRAE